MSADLHQSFLQKSTPLPKQHCWGSFGFSTVVHFSVLAVLGTVWTSLAEGPGTGNIDSSWQPVPDKSVKEPELQTLVLPQTETRNLDVGGNRAGLAVQNNSQTPLVVKVAGDSSDSLAAIFENSLLADNLGEEVGALPVSGNPTTGQGSGNGKGDGHGNGFFGIGTEGTRFVYVVDCSRSMNFPHPSPAKTRFKRLKLELLKSVTAMDEGKEFFIIFFNHEAIPMKANSLQPATLTSQKKYLYWMNKIRATGDTDPRKAMMLALKLQPDVIYFLTDGDFHRVIKSHLVQIKQQRTAIHTFAFGNRAGESVLQKMAQQNRGRYHFIP